MDFNVLLSAGVALSEVMSVAQEKILGDQHTLVFFLKDLRWLYQDWLKYLGADEDVIKNVNVTRLKQLLGEIPRLQGLKNGNFVILTVEEDVDRAIVERWQNAWHDEGIILSKAEKLRESYVNFFLPKRKDLKETSLNNNKKCLIRYVSYSTEKQQVKMH